MKENDFKPIDVTPDRERRGLKFLAGITKISKSKFPDISVSTDTSMNIMRGLESLTRFDEKMGDIEGARGLKKVSDNIDRELAFQYGVYLTIWGNDDVRIRSFVGTTDDLAKTLQGWRSQELIITESTQSRVAEIWGEPLGEGQPTRITSVDYIFE